MREPVLSLFAVLRQHGVPFVVIGGHAVNVHGFIRATEDHDIVYLRSLESEAALLRALESMHARWISDERDPATNLERTIPVTESFVRSRPLMMLITDLGFLDVFDHVPGCPGASVEQLAADALEVEGVRYASREWLLRMKRASARPRDRLDVEELEKLDG